MKPELTTETLQAEAASFAKAESAHEEPNLYGVTDGKAVGTYLEHKFQDLLHTRYTYEQGSSAKGIDREILERDGNSDDPIAFTYDRNLPIDEMEAVKLARELLANPPELGYLTISNALQWRLQYRRIIENAGMVDGILRVS